LEIVGVVPGAQLWAIRVLAKNGNSSDASVLCGVDYVTSTRLDADPTNDIAVANMSLGGRGSDDRNCGLPNDDPLHAAICASTAAGVTYVAAAGYDGTDLATHVPAGYDEVLTVTAITVHDGQPGGTGLLRPPCNLSWADDTPALFSNFATLASDQAHTIAAPGVCIWSTWIAPANAALVSGTSQASPAVAGTAALVSRAAPAWGHRPKSSRSSEAMRTPTTGVTRATASAATHCARSPESTTAIWSGQPCTESLPRFLQAVHSALMHAAL
jgi:subtilisin